MAASSKAQTMANFLKASGAVSLASAAFTRGDVPKALDVIAQRILTKAKKGAPVDTGALRSSGRVKRVNQYRRIIQFGGAGTGVDYALAVHMGTATMSPRPFLRIALMQSKKDIAKLLAEKGQKRFSIMAKMASS